MPVIIEKHRSGAGTRALSFAMPHRQPSQETKDAAHLSYKQKTNLGSFYTPPHLVRLLYTLLAKVAASASFADTVLEPSCGYGAFFEENFPQKNVRKIGADVDDDALAVARRTLPGVSFFNTNALAHISRVKYGIGKHERLVIVGNPPYNDITSHVKNQIKATPCEIAPEVRTRDLGLSSLLAMARLEPDYIAVLHPLSYLIKEANFKILSPLMRDYALRDTVVFNSQEFSETSKGTSFPIVAAVYARHPHGTKYEQVRHHRFRTLESAHFALSDYDYACRYIAKYPSRFSSASNARNGARLRFFTMRDINALKRSRTFIKEDTANTIYIIPEKIHYYCYIDAFKGIAPRLPYYLGNFDVMINHSSFERIKDDFLTLSIAKHPEIFMHHYPFPSASRLDSANKRVRRHFDAFLKV